ncbi:hypothetical protein HK096_004605, partial [Nowakowskiella sp. JEL0078]
IYLNFDSIVKSKLEPQETAVYWAYIDLASYDIVLQITNISSNIQLKVVVTSIHPMGSKSGTSPEFIILATDPSRYAGKYIFQVQNPTTEGNNISASYEISLSLRLSNNKTSFGQNSPFTALDITTFVLVFAVSMAFTLIVSWLIKRTRERIILLRQIRRGEVVVPPILPPNFFRVRLISIEEKMKIQDEKLTPDSKKNTMPSIVASNKTRWFRKKSDESDTSNYPLLFSGKLKNKGKQKSEAHTIEMNIVNSKPFNDSKMNVFDTRINPLSIESITLPSQETPLVAVNFIVLLPKSGNQDSDTIPNCAIGTTIFKDGNSHRERPENIVNVGAADDIRPQVRIPWWRELWGLLSHNPNTTLRGRS